MARVVVIDPDPRTRRRFAELIRPLGHTADLFADETAALAGWGIDEPAVVLAGLGPGGALAEGIWETMQTLGAERVIWTGPIPEMALKLLQSGKGHGFVMVPPTAPAVAALFGDDQAPGGADWSGPQALEAVDGSAKRVPLAQVLFLAHRIGATGRVEVSGGGAAFSIGVQSGRVVAWSGLPGLLEERLEGVSPSGAGDLMGQLGAAIGQGASPDLAMQTAAVALGARVAATLQEPGLHVRWRADGFGAGAPMPLPTPIPSLLASGLSEARGPVAVRRTYGPRRKLGVRATQPNDAPESQWRLPPVALRMVREAGRVDTLGELLAAAGGESDATWRALDLVVQLGLVAISEAAVSAPRRRPAPAVQAPDPADDIEVTAVEAAAVVDPELERLTQTLADLTRAEPHVVLGVKKADDASVEGLDQLFIERSAEFHPDRLAGADAKLKRLSEQCFTRVADAREALQDSDRRIELVERLRAAEAGVPWASYDDRRKAVLIGKQGEIALKKGSWDEAWRHLDRARRTDPTEFRYGFHALHAGWRAGKIPPHDAVQQLLALDGLTRGQAGDAFALAGEILLREELDEDHGYSLLEKAVERNPELVDAKRRLRLRDMRRRKEDDAQRQQAGPLRGLLRWGRKGDGGAGSA